MEADPKIQNSFGEKATKHLEENRDITSYLQEQMELCSVERPGPVPGLLEREGRWLTEVVPPAEDWPHDEILPMKKWGIHITVFYFQRSLILNYVVQLIP